MSNLTLPNLLSLLRIAAVPFLLVAMTQKRFDVALLLFLVAGITDLLDGWLARRFGWTSPLGALLDPAGDKLLLNAVYIGLAVPMLPARVHLPVWLAVLVFCRDLIIVSISLLLALDQGQKQFPPSFLGKTTTFVLIVDAGAALLANVLVLPDLTREAIVWTATTVTVLSGFHYILLASGMAAKARSGERK